MLFSIFNFRSTLLGSLNHAMQTTEETIKKHGAQLGTVVSDSIRSRLRAELESTIVSIFLGWLNVLFRSIYRLLIKNQWHGVIEDIDFILRHCSLL